MTEAAVRAEAEAAANALLAADGAEAARRAAARLPSDPGGMLAQACDLGSPALQAAALESMAIGFAHDEEQGAVGAGIAQALLGFWSASGAPDPGVAPGQVLARCAETAGYGLLSAALYDEMVSHAREWRPRLAAVGQPDAAAHLAVQEAEALLGLRRYDEARAALPEPPPPPGTPARMRHESVLFNLPDGEDTTLDLQAQRRKALEQVRDALRGMAPMLGLPPVMMDALEQRFAREFEGPPLSDDEVKQRLASLLTTLGTLRRGPGGA